MKTAKYPLETGEFLEVDYDENAPCKMCGFPVKSASMGGTDVCPSCDMGKHHDGTPVEMWELALIKKRLDALPKPIPLDMDAVRAGKVPGFRVVGKRSEKSIAEEAKKLTREYA